MAYASRRVGKLVIVFAHALIGWVWCGAVMIIGQQFLPINAALIVHAVAAPLGFSLLSAVYFRRFSLTSPLVTAACFVLTVITLDALVVAPLIEGDYSMFASLLGTWVPFVLIFGATYATGLLLSRSEPSELH